MLTTSVKTHKRKIYDIVALLGDLGGVTEVIMLVLGIVLFPISESSYNILSTKRMFLARTGDDNLFVELSEEKKRKIFGDSKHLEEGLQTMPPDEIRKHRFVKMNRKDTLCYYLQNQFGSFYLCGYCWKNKKKIVKLIDEA